MKTLSELSSGVKKFSPASRLVSTLRRNSPLRSSSESGSRISTLERSCSSSSCDIIFLYLSPLITVNDHRPQQSDALDKRYILPIGGVVSPLFSYTLL